MESNKTEIKVENTNTSATVKNDDEKKKQDELKKQQEEFEKQQGAINKEYERIERAELEKERKREYYREQDAKREKRLSAIEQQLAEMRELIETQNEILQKQQPPKVKVDEHGFKEGTFEYELNLAHKDRVREEEQKRHSIDYIADMEYSMFCIWCNVKKPIIIPGTENNGGKIDYKQMQEKIYNDEKLFNKYCETEKPKGFEQRIPDFWIKKKIFEKWFNYKFDWDNASQKWKAIKQS